MRLEKRFYHRAGLLAAGDVLLGHRETPVTKTMFHTNGVDIDVWLSDGTRLTLARADTVVTVG